MSRVPYRTFLFAVAVLACSACSGSGGTAVTPVFATAAPTATASPGATASPVATASPAPSATPMPSPTPSAVPTAAVTLTPAQIPAPQFTGNGEFSFDQNTPLVVDAPSTGPDLHRPYVSERFYVGTFTLAGCSTSTPGATCVVQTEGGDQQATCSSGSTTLGLSLETDDSLYDDGLTGTVTPLTCAVTFTDAYGHATSVTLMDDAPNPTATPFPAATGDGNFSFSQASPVTVSFAASPLPIVVSEGHYSGQFYVVGCQFPSEFQCHTAYEQTDSECTNPGSQVGNVGSETDLATDTESLFSDFFFASGSAPFGAPVFSCSYIIGDQFGHSVPFVVRTLPSVSPDSSAVRSPGSIRAVR